MGHFHGGKFFGIKWKPRRTWCVVPWLVSNACGAPEICTPSVPPSSAPVINPCELGHSAVSVTPCDPMDWSPPGSSAHEVLQARTMQGVAVPSSRRSSWPRDRTQVSWVSCIGRRILDHWAMWEACDYPKFSNVSNLNFWNLPSRHLVNDAHVVKEEVQQGHRRTAGCGYLVPQVGRRGNPGGAPDRGGQFLEVGHRTAAAGVEGDGDVHSIRCLQAPAHHVHKLKHRGKGWSRVPVAPLAMAESRRAERAVGQPPCGKGRPRVSPPVSDSRSAPSWPIETRSSQRIVAICTWDLSFSPAHILTFSRCPITVWIICK